MKKRAIKPVIVLLLPGLIGCSSLFNPGLEHRNFAHDSKEYPKFWDVVEKHANPMILDLRDKQRDMEIYDFVTGTMLFGLGIAGIAVGVFDGPRTALLGIGLGGAAVAGSRSFIPFRERQKIYARGQKTIACGISVLNFRTGSTSTDNSRVLGKRQNTSKDDAPPPDDPLPVRNETVSVNDATNLSGVNLQNLRKQAETVKENLKKKQDSLTASAGSRQASPVLSLLAMETAGLLASVASTDDAVAEVQKALDLSDETRSETLRSILAIATILINEQLADNVVDVEKAQQQLNGYLQSFLKPLGDAALNARNEARKIDNNKSKVTAIASVVATTKDEPTHKAADVEKAAEQAGDLKTNVSAQMTQILSTLTAASKCFGGLEQSPPDQ